MVAGYNHTFEFRGRDGRENHAGRVGSYTRHTEEQPEQAPLLLVDEAEELMGVLPNHFVHEQACLRLSLKGGERRKGDVEEIAYAVAVNHGVSGSEFGHRARNVFNHCFLLYFYPANILQSGGNI